MHAQPHKHPKGSELHEMCLDDFETITLCQKCNWASDFVN